MDPTRSIYNVHVDPFRVEMVPRQFTLFPLLPPELRIMVWVYAIHGTPSTRIIISGFRQCITPMPALLQVCAEARYIFLSSAISGATGYIFICGGYVNLYRDELEIRSYGGPDPLNSIYLPNYLQLAWTTPRSHRSGIFIISGSTGATGRARPLMRRLAG